VGLSKVLDPKPEKKLKNTRNLFYSDICRFVIKIVVGHA
jgi:hypothetical protein